MKINWLVRFKNPLFIAQLVLAIMTPVLAYAGITAEAVTTWTALGQLLLSAVKNPYVLCLVVVSVYNAVTDPTTEGTGDSLLALSYTEPKHKGD